MKPLVALLFLISTSLLAGWTTGGPTGGAVNTVVVAPSNPAIVWAGNTAGVFRSTDAGATWANVSGPVVDVDVLVVHPTDPNKAWVVTGSFPASRLYRTSDGGATWIDSTDGLPTMRPVALLIDPRDPDTLFVASRCDPRAFDVVGPRALAFSRGPGAGVYKSTDGGVTWHAALNDPDPFQPCINELALDPFSPWRLFASGGFAEDGQIESYDLGQTWEPAGGPRPSRAVVFDARFPFTHYGISGGQFFVSQDGGFTWSVVATHLLTPDITPTALSMDPQRSRIFLGTTTGVFRSGNGGTVWAPTTLQGVEVHALDFGQTLFAATASGLFELVDRGVGAARPIDLHDASANVVSIAVDPTDPNVVYAGTRDRVFRSGDAGKSWEHLPNDDSVRKADAMSVDAAGTLYATSLVTPSTFRRKRGETSWTVIGGVWGSDIAADPKNAGTLFVAGAAALLRSRDSGATWQIVHAGGGGPLAIDPSDPRWVYDGLARSSDGGDTWTVPSSTSLPTYALAIAPSNGSVLYRITQDLGLPRLERSDDRAATWRRLPLASIYPQGRRRRSAQCGLGVDCRGCVPLSLHRRRHDVAESRSAVPRRQWRDAAALRRDRAFARGLSRARGVGAD
jgi:photosystem II stability/assembly factor-like uncharacterized protein